MAEIREREGERQPMFLRDVDGVPDTIAGDDDHAGTVSGGSNTFVAEGEYVPLAPRRTSDYASKVRIYVVPMVIATGEVLARGDCAFAVRAVTRQTHQNRKEPASGASRASHTIDTAPQTENVVPNRWIDIDVRNADAFSVLITDITDLPAGCDRLRIYYHIDD